MCKNETISCISTKARHYITKHIRKSGFHRGEINYETLYLQLSKQNPITSGSKGKKFQKPGYGTCIRENTDPNYKQLWSSVIVTKTNSYNILEKSEVNLQVEQTLNYLKHAYYSTAKTYLKLFMQAFLNFYLEFQCFSEINASVNQKECEINYLTEGSYSLFTMKTQDAELQLLMKHEIRKRTYHLNK